MEYEHELVVSSLAWKDLQSAHDKVTGSLYLCDSLNHRF